MTLRNRVTGPPCDPYNTPRRSRMPPLYATRSVRRASGFVLVAHSYKTRPPHLWRAAPARAATARAPGRRDAGGGEEHEPRPAKPERTCTGVGGHGVTARPRGRLVRLVSAAREARFQTPLHGRRCLRWYESLTALAPRQRHSRSAAAARSHRTCAGAAKRERGRRRRLQAAPRRPAHLATRGGARISEKPRGFHRCAVANVRLLHMLVGRFGA